MRSAKTYKKPKTNPGHDLLIGVIGSGGRGGLASRAHQPGKGARIVACCDIRPDTLERNRSRYGADIFTTNDFRKLLALDLDAVFVCSPDFLHETHALAALKARKAVYLEKPLAIQTSSADRILKAAAETGTLLYVGHNMRHMQVIQIMKKLIDSGEIGEVKTAWCRHFVSNGGDFYYKDWHADRSKSNTLLLQKASHDIDVLHWLCSGYSSVVNAMGSLMVYGQIPRSRRTGNGYRNRLNEKLDTWPPLTQKGINPTVDVEDVNLMQMKLDNGVLCAYQQCHFTPDYWRNYTFIGTEGRIENSHRKGKQVVNVWNRRHRSFAEPDLVIPVPKVRGGHDGADGAIVAEFLRFVRGEKFILTSPVAARNSVAAGCAAAESLRSGGRPVKVPLLPQSVQRYFKRFDNGTVSKTGRIASP
jgi:predicted dehydrogenase